MDYVRRFLEYAAAFEQTFLDDDWARLEQYFTSDAVYLPGDGSAAEGRRAVLDTLRASVNGLDRLFATRTPSFDQPEADGNVVTLHWRVHFAAPAVPDLEVRGREYATFDGDAIVRLEDVFEDAAGVGRYLVEHGESLKAAS